MCVGNIDKIIAGYYKIVVVSTILWLFKGSTLT